MADAKLLRSLVPAGENVAKDLQASIDKGNTPVSCLYYTVTSDQLERCNTLTATPSAGKRPPPPKKKLSPPPPRPVSRPPPPSTKNRPFSSHSRPPPSKSTVAPLRQRSPSPPRRPPPPQRVPVTTRRYQFAGIFAQIRLYTIALRDGLL